MTNPNAQKKSFKGENLAGQNFSGRNIRGVNFSNASLIGADFSDVQAGQTIFFHLFLIITCIISSYISGYISAYAGGVVGSIMTLPEAQPVALLSGMLVVACLILCVLVVLKQGIGIGLGILTFVISVTITLVAGFGKPDYTALAVVQFLALSGSTAGFILGAASLTSLLTSVDKLGLSAFFFSYILGALLGGKEGLRYEDVNYLFGFLSVTTTVGVSLISLLASSLIVITILKNDNDHKFLVISNFAKRLSALGGTSFVGANLTDAQFSNAYLGNTNFKGANLQRVRWLGAKGLDHSILSGTYLDNWPVRDLLLSGDGTNQNFSRLDMRGFNLEDLDFSGANLMGADLSYSNLKRANLSKANLAQCRFYDSDLTGVYLTGAYIQDWSLSTDTILRETVCKFIYMRLPTEEDPDPWRKPDNREDVFKPGDFEDFISPIIKTLDIYKHQDLNSGLSISSGRSKTLDLYHHEGLDPTAAVLALKELSQQYPEANLEIVSLEGHRNEKIRLQATISETINQSQLSRDYFLKYKEILSLSYGNLQALLSVSAEKDERIRSLERMLTTAMEGNKFYVETYYNMGDTMSDKSSINIQAGGNIGSVSGIVGGDVSGVVNLGSISGSVSNTVSQLPNHNTDEDGPSLKELLTQLQAAIESDHELTLEDKAEALEQIGVIAEAGKNPEDNAIQKAGKTAMKILKGTTASLSETNNLVKECKNLLPIIIKILPFLI